MNEEIESCGQYSVFEKAHDLITVIVKKGLSEKVLILLKAGAEGGTIMFGRGTGFMRKQSFLAFRLSPKKK